MKILLSLVMFVVLGMPPYGAGEQVKRACCVCGKSECQGHRPKDTPKPEKVWNWDGNGVDDKFVDRTTKKEPYFEKAELTKPNTCCKEEELHVPTQGLLAKRQQKAPVSVPVPVNLLYNRFPMIAPNGTFNSIRYLDLNRGAGTMYNVSGAAIKAYGLRSMYERNQLERMLDNEQAWRRISRPQLLSGQNVPGFVNLEPWQPTKKKCDCAK